MTMERRKILLAGIAATGAASLPLLVSKTASAAATSGSTMSGPSIFDFGAVGDGVTDDSAAFTQALAFAASQGRMVRVPSFTYAIARPVNFTSAGNVGNTWGLACEGATLLSKIRTGENVLNLVSRHTVRYLRITGYSALAARISSITSPSTASPSREWARAACCSKAMSLKA
jgi:hypothetical protein